MDGLERMPRTELILGTEYNECSIAAATLAQTAETITGQLSRWNKQKLFVASSPGGFQEMTMRAKDVTREFPSPAGRNLKLVLGKPKDRYPTLLAVTRRDVAIPVASFGRRNDPGCDFVQIGPEMNDWDLVVTPVDERQRKATIDNMQEILAWHANPLDLDTARIITQARRIDLDYLVGRIHFHNRRLYEQSSLAQDINDIRQLGSLAAAYASCVGRGYSYRRQAEERGGSTFHDQLSTIRTFLAKPDLDALIEGRVKIYNKLAADMVLKTAADKIGYPDAPAINRYAAILKSFSDQTNIDGQFDKQLGKFSKAAETVLALSRKLHLIGGRGDFNTILEIGATLADVEFSVRTQQLGKTATRLMVYSRPTALRGSTPQQVYNLIVDRCDEVGVGDEDGRELVRILNLAIANDKDAD